LLLLELVFVSAKKSEANQQNMRGAMYFSSPAAPTFGNYTASQRDRQTFACRRRGALQIPRCASSRACSKFVRLGPRVPHCPSMLFSRKHRWIALLDQRGFRGAVINLTRVNIFVLAPRVALTLGVLLFVLIVFADYVSSYELSLTPFYLFVVLLVTWNCGTTSGFVFSVLSFITPLILGIEFGNPYSEPLYFYVDNTNRLISYLVAWALTAQLKKQHEQEKDSARRDYTTGLANQKGFYEAFTVEIARHRRENIPLSIAYLDCDNFKEVNDRFGHREGDRLLEMVAKTLKANLRKTDVTGRLGGDEFAIVFCNTGEQHAIAAVGKLRRELDAVMTGNRWPVTFSVGVGIFNSVLASEDAMISFTDKLMYRVKSAGKNNVSIEVFEAIP